jgi:MFS family permease
VNSMERFGGEELGQEVSPRKVAFASSVGATIEWYDFFIFGTAAGLVFNQLFFTNLDPITGTLVAYLTFAVGFVARPVGSVIFGHYGDRIGRKTMLILTLFIMGVATFIIGLLPTYEQIGIWAPILLVVMRIFQGIGIGGEYGGAVLMAVEYAPEGRRGFYGSWPQAGVPAGLLLGTAAFGLLSLLPNEQFLAWGWRIAFLASIVLVGIGMYIRLQILETPAFTRVRETQEEARIPFTELLRTQPKELILGMGLRWVEGLVFNAYGVFAISYIVSQLELTRSTALTGGHNRFCLWSGTRSDLRAALRPPRPSGSIQRGRCTLRAVRLPLLLADQYSRAGPDLVEHRGGARAYLSCDIRSLGGVVVRTLRHPRPLHGGRIRLPVLGDIRQWAYADYRHAAARVRGRRAVVVRWIHDRGHRHKPGGGLCITGNVQ